MNEGVDEWRAIAKHAVSLPFFLSFGFLSHEFLSLIDSHAILVTR